MSRTSRTSSLLPSTCYSEEIQNRIAYTLYKSGMIIASLVHDDIPSVHTCTLVLRGNPFIHENAKGRWLTEESAARMLQLTFIVSSLVWQYVIAGWSLYFISTISGLTKIFHSIFLNPIFGMLFLITFNARALSETDTAVMTKINKAFFLPENTLATGKAFREAIVKTLLPSIAGKNTHGYIKAYYVLSYGLDQLVQRIPAMTLDLAESAKNKYIGLLLNVVKSTDLEQMDMKYAATYFPKTVELDYYDSEGIISFVEKNEGDMIKLMAGEGKRRGKKKKHQKEYDRELHERMRARDKSGVPVCLNECKGRIKTEKGCVCEGPCSAYITGRSWCYVDPNKCKGVKLDSVVRPSISGVSDWKPSISLNKSYDYCNKDGIQTTNCWDGYKYGSCVTK